MFFMYRRYLLSTLNIQHTRLEGLENPRLPTKMVLYSTTCHALTAYIRCQSQKYSGSPFARLAGLCTRTRKETTSKSLSQQRNENKKHSTVPRASVQAVRRLLADTPKSHTEDRSTARCVQPTDRRTFQLTEKGIREKINPRERR